MTETEALLIEIKDAAARMGIEPSTLCVRAVENSRIPKMLATNKTVTLKTLTRLREFIAANAPSKSEHAA